MNNTNNIQENLELICHSEGDGFVVDVNSLNQAVLHLNEEKSGIAIKALSIAGGFMATLSFIGFLLVAGLYDSKACLTILGVLFISCAIWINIKTQRQIIDTSAISVYITGFCLLGFGLSRYKIDENLLYLLFVIIASLSISIVQRYILSFISVLIIMGSILFLIVFNNHAYDMIHVYNSMIVILLTYFFLKEAKIITTSRKLSLLYNPVRAALIVSLLACLMFVGKRGLIHLTAEFVWLSSAVTIPAVIYLVSFVLDILEIKEQRKRMIIYIASALVLIPTSNSPAISGSLLIILLCFLVNYRTGFVIGIIAFIYFVGQYYCDLQFNLLTKSMLLISTGILFIVFFLFTYKKTGVNEKI